MDELMRVMREELGRLERKFEKLVEDVKHRQSEILEALERLERERTTYTKSLERLEKQVEKNLAELQSLGDSLKHS